MNKLAVILLFLFVEWMYWAPNLSAQPIEEGRWTGFMFTPGVTTNEIDAQFMYQGDSLYVALTFPVGVFEAHHAFTEGDILAYQWNPAFTVECRLRRQDDGHYQGACRDPWGNYGPLLIAPEEHELTMEAFDIDIALEPWNITSDVLDLRKLAEEKPPEGTLVDIGGRQINYLDRGEGDITVVLESGMGDDLSAWNEVHARLSEFTRVVSYDRAGLGLSSPGPERTLDNVALDLHQLLQSAGIEPPYVLVGHQLGSVFIRKFTAQYPDEVAGLVLVDPVHEQLRLHVRRLDPRSWDTYFHGKATFYEIVAGPAKEEFNLYVRLLNSGYLDGIGALADIPTFIVSGIRPMDDPIWVGDTPQGQQVTNDLHKQWAETLTSGKHAASLASGSYVHWEEPGLVVSAVRQVMQMIEGER